MIKNITKKKLIISDYKIANTVFSRGLGLMFSRKSKFNYGLIFDLERETVIGASLHMFFVFYPINVIFLNSKKQIVDIKTDFRPFTFYSTNKKCRYIIELPKNIGLRYYSLNDRISWKNIKN
jgi:hypothetical protein